MLHTDRGSMPAVCSGSPSLVLTGLGTPDGRDAAAQDHELHHLRVRLQSLPVIEQAKGLLIGLYGIDPDTAFELLRHWSSHTNTKLRLISERLVAAASHPRAGETPHQALLRVIQQWPPVDLAQVRSTMSR